MNTKITKRATGLLGAAAVLLAVAVALPALSSADRGHSDGHHDRTVGTIASFDADSGALVISPTNGDDVTGTVDERTRIDCEHEHGDDHGDDGPNHDQGDDNDDGHGGHGPGKSGHGSGRRGNCSPDDLTAGATVEEAELEITADGLVFEEVELR